MTEDLDKLNNAGRPPLLVSPDLDFCQLQAGLHVEDVDSEVLPPEPLDQDFLLLDYHCCNRGINHDTYGLGATDIDLCCLLD